jgi:hypothetical protein
MCGAHTLSIFDVLDDPSAIPNRLGELSSCVDLGKRAWRGPDESSRMLETLNWSQTIPDVVFAFLNDFIL